MLDVCPGHALNGVTSTVCATGYTALGVPIGAGIACPFIQGDSGPAYGVFPNFTLQLVVFVIMQQMETFRL
ncbi:hypothetical protein GCM10023310_38720 [Paenibacillus vulneris]